MKELFRFVAIIVIIIGGYVAYDQAHYSEKYLSNAEFSTQIKKLGSRLVVLRGRVISIRNKIYFLKGGRCYLRLDDGVEIDVWYRCASVRKKPVNLAVVMSIKLKITGRSQKVNIGDGRFVWIMFAEKIYEEG